MDQKSRKTNEFGHSFVTKSVRYGRAELSLRLWKALGDRRDLSIQKGFRACFLKNKRNIMIQTLSGRGRKQPKWDPSQNRQKQPLPKPKTIIKCP